MTLRRSGIVLALTCTAVAMGSASACGGDSFSSGKEQGHGGGSMTDGGSDGGGEAGTSAGGRAGGSGGSGDPAGGGGSESGGQGDGGSGGEPPCDDGTTCPEGRYCSALGVCELCSDITSLDDPARAIFGAPEPLSVLNDAAGDWFLRTPRAFGSEGALLYVRDFFGGEIWLTGDPENDVGAPLAGPINEPDFLEGSPLFLNREVGSAFASSNFIFNRAAGGNSAYEFYGAHLDANGTPSEMMRLPAPFNPVQPLTESGYAMAVSRDRAWWTVNRDLIFAIQFLTAPLDQAGPPSVVPLRLSEDCAPTEFDLSAWVTPDGKLLFVSMTEREADCSPLSGEPKDLIVFKLNESGQALGPGVPVSGVNRTGVSEVDASLSVDMCWLYFSGMEADKLRLMRSRREG